MSENKKFEESPEFFISKSKDPFSVDTSSHLANEYVFHGTNEKALSSLLELGVNSDFFIDVGKSGRAFYTATDIKMALNHSVSDESSKGVILLFKINSKSKILTEDNDAFYDLNNHVGSGKEGQKFKKEGYDGLFIKAFNEVALYNPSSITLVSFLPKDAILDCIYSKRFEHDSGFSF